jgi:hypothetical protein
MAGPALPGAEIVGVGLRDLLAGNETDAALLVSIGAPRLRRLGVVVPRTIENPEHRLYARLLQAEGDSAHSRYNALLNRLVSYERALSCAR